MKVTLSTRKYISLATESLRNSLRLLRDAQTLYANKSYAGAYQLAVLALEEFAKAKWIDHVYYANLTNGGKPDAAFEQKWLSLLYSHEAKQSAFVQAEYWHFSPKLLTAIQTGALDRRKQAATYVGLPKRGKLIDVNARISKPSSVTQSEAKQLISLVTTEIRFAYKMIEKAEMYFGIAALDDVVTSHAAMFIFEWKHRAGLKSARFRASNRTAP